MIFLFILFFVGNSIKAIISFNLLHSTSLDLLRDGTPLQDYKILNKGWKSVQLN